MPQSRQRATILEVAHAAGTSKTSVSRYFGGERERLSRELQGRIAAAARRLGYRPNQMARGLKGGRSRLIGMLVADIRNPYSVAVMHGVEQACRARGYSLLVGNTDNDPAQERRHLALLAAYRVEGLVINAAGSPDRELARLAEQGTPLVLVDRELGEVPADVVGLDNARAIDQALDHLQAAGYREVLYLSEPPDQASSRRARLARFRHGLAAHGLSGEARCLSIGHGPAAVGEVIDGVLASPATIPRALLCANGNLTLAVTRHLQAHGTPLGEVGLMGIDELDWCELVGPGITTLAQPTDAIGRAAVENLLQRLESPQPASPPRRTRYQAQLIPRGSTRLPFHHDRSQESP
ncbi:LacI family DNA-binding transcriptional regulator [Halomonas sp. NO4]|uniref:LacI family DNA-binding transcriptional regulator n=1 Tax=Halomonas sp. NO4 TaxID=2484813 RepID=UPI0013D6D3AD|nr:LacI family DNA-binding transcriptional regulator [Halomonas sp. NO4]